MLSFHSVHIGELFNCENRETTKNREMCENLWKFVNFSLILLFLLYTLSHYSHRLYLYSFYITHVFYFKSFFFSFLRILL